MAPAPAAGVAGGEPQAASGGTLWLEEGLAPPLAPERAAACYVCTLTAIPGRSTPYPLLGAASIAPSMA